MIIDINQKKIRQRSIDSIIGFEPYKEGSSEKCIGKL